MLNENLRFEKWNLRGITAAFTSALDHRRGCVVVLNPKRLSEVGFHEHWVQRINGLRFRAPLDHALCQPLRSLLALGGRGGAETTIPLSHFRDGGR